MITDRFTNCLYLSDKLKKKFPEFFKEFTKSLYDNGINFYILKGTKDIWCRDYMPIEVTKGKYVLFKYNPSYLKGGYENTITNAKEVCKNIGIKVKPSNILLDGGNVVRSNDSVIITDRVFKENPTIEKNELIKKLQKLFEKAKVLIIPAQPYDDLGHADGMVRFLNDKTVLVNDYSKTTESSSFKQKLYGTLASCGLDILLVPYYPDNTRNKMGVQSAVGTYINYLQIDSKVFLPVFGNKDNDLEAISHFERIFGKNIVPVDSKDIALDGGVLNCITWSTFKMFAPPNKLPKYEVDFQEMKNFVFDHVPFRLFHDEFEDIESGFRKKWNEKSGDLFGDGDFKNSVYRHLEKLKRKQFIPQPIVDGVVDALLEYMETIGQYGHDYSKN